MQSNCLRLMAKKMLVSLAMEGKFSAAGLNAFEEDDDMLTAMARELVRQQGIGESADAVWRDMQVQQRSILPTKLVVPAASGTDVGSLSVAAKKGASLAVEREPVAGLRSGLRQARK